MEEEEYDDDDESVFTSDNEGTNDAEGAFLLRRGVSPTSSDRTPLGSFSTAPSDSPVTSGLPRRERYGSTAQSYQYGTQFPRQYFYVQIFNIHAILTLTANA